MGPAKPGRKSAQAGAAPLSRGAGMGGRRCLEELMKMNPWLKVVIASGHSVNGPAKAVLETGAKGFINKPYDVNQMLKIIREVLDEH